MATVSSPETGNESKKPNESDFSQQKLPAWQPILTAGTVLPAFFVIGIAFVAIGVGLLHFSNEVLEFHADYTQCKNENGEICWEVIKKYWNTTEDKTVKPPDNICTCNVDITVDQDMAKPVYMYYGLTNFYQNHRRYVKSRDESQLLGDVTKVPNSDCAPYDKGKASDGSEKPIVPCGAIANSLFNDTITLEDDEQNTIPLSKTGIAWDSDKKYKFKNPTPPEGYKDLAEYLKNVTVSPPNWGKPLWELDTTDDANNGLLNEDLIVWMRTAAFPNFRKLYRKIEKDPNTNGSDVLKKGTYKLKIQYNYRVDQFAGTKSIYLSQTSILGGKNPFLGVAYIVVGCICLLIGIAFLIIHVKYGRLTRDMMDMGRRG